MAEQRCWHDEHQLLPLLLPVAVSMLFFVCYSCAVVAHCCCWGLERLLLLLLLAGLHH
jgi:hypothetical protein